MNHRDERFLRLGLLLTGGGSRIRRLAAGAGAGESLASGLVNAGAPRSVLDSAARLAESEADAVLRHVAEIGWRWIVPGDEEYPALLRATADPPLGLFVRGALDGSPAVAVVGSRKATPYGLQVARLLGEEIARAGAVMVSGMARGIDEAAHRGALAQDGKSWAVWGTGPDRVYPAEHRGLAQELSARGALITEYPPGTPPRRHHFPERNRILAGLARVVVVVEAAARSGALITARLASEEGREVMAVPGNIFSELSVGPNTLLRIGARPLLTPRDLFEAIGCPPPDERPSVPEPALMRLIGAGEALSADELAERAEAELGEVLRDLLALELAGEIMRRADGRYARVRAPKLGEEGSAE